MKTRLGLIALILLLVRLHPAPVHAGTTFTVTRLDDPAPNGCDVGGCSLREAILDANGFIGDDTIVLPAATITLSIAGQNEDTGATGDLDITSNITISGAGAGSTVIHAGTTTANGIDRVIQILIGATVTISGVTIANGHLDNGSTLFLGGGINNSGTLTLTNSTVSSNTTVIGGGINNSGTLTLTKSTVSGNTAANGGGGIFTSGTAILNDSVVRSNTASVIGGGIFNNGTVTLNSSTVSGNSSNGSGGGICNNSNATLTLNNSTIGGSISDERNTAATDGGGLFNRGNTTLNQSKVGGNLSTNGNGGGIFNETNASLTVTGGTLQYNNLLLAGTNGGGLYNAGSASFSLAAIDHNGAVGNGAGIYNTGPTLNVTASTIFANTTNGGNGGGVYNYSGTMTIERSTIYTNHVLTQPYGTGGGIYHDTNATTNLTYSTISGNDAIAAGGGLYVQYTSSNPITVYVIDATFSGNAASNGGGIYSNSGTVYIPNSILANNPGGNCGGPGTVGGNGLRTIVDDSTCGYVDGRNPLLGPLQNNGGPTPTHALLAGSPAIDNGQRPYYAADQRGFSSPVDGDHDGSAISDSGAYEYGAAMKVFLPLVRR